MDLPSQVSQDNLRRMQPGRTIAVALTLWSLVATPALCRSGLLLHRCDGGEVECCAWCDCEGASPCPHEEGCEQDPCGKPIPRVEIGQRAPQMSTFGMIAVLVEDEAAAYQGRDLRRTSVEARPSGQHLPFPESDVPLLI